MTQWKRLWTSKNAFYGNDILPFFPERCPVRGIQGSCQVVTEFLSGDHLTQGLHCTDGLPEQVDTVNLAKGSTFVVEKTPIAFDFQHLI